MEQIQVGELSKYLSGGHLFPIQEKWKKNDERMEHALTI